MLNIKNSIKNIKIYLLTSEGFSESAELYYYFLTFEKNEKHNSKIHCHEGIVT